MADTEDGPRFGFDADTARELGGAFGDLAAMFLAGTPNISDFLGAVEGATGPLRGLTGLFKQVSGYLENQLTLYQQLSRSGVHFSGRFDEMSIAAISARMSLERLAEVTKENSETIAGFAGSADAGMRQFLARSAQFMDTEYATGLRRLGMTFDDINDSMLQYESILAMTGHTNAMSDAQRNRAAYEFALELDQLSKLTGKQAEQIADEMRERAREGDYRAFLMGLSPEQAAAVQLEQARADAAGYGDLFKDMMVRGVASTRETRLQSAMMGGTTRELAAMRGALMAGDIEGFQAMGAGAQGIAFGEMSSEVYRATAMLSPFSEVGQAAANGLGSMSEASFRLASQFREFADTMGRPPTQAEMAMMQRQIEADIEREQRTQMETPTDPNDTRNVMNAIIGVQDVMLATAEEVQVQATSRLYQALAQEVQGFTTSLNNFDPSVIVDRIATGFEDFLQGAGFNPNGSPLPTDDEITRILERARQIGDENAREAALQAENLREALRDPNLSAAERTRIEDELASLLDTIDDVTILNGNVTIIGPENVSVGSGFSEGTIGATGNILADFGRESLAVLHGREAVLNEDQLTALASNLLQIGRSQNIVGSLRGLVNTIAPQMQQLAMQMQSGQQPQFQQMASEMLPMLESMATQMQGPMREIAEQMRGPMEQMAGTMTRQLGVSTRQLRAVRGAGNMFRGISA